MSAESQISSAARKNIDAIAKVEQELLRKQSTLERLGQAIARFFGSLLFILAHGAFFTGWILWNTGVIAADHRLCERNREVA
jgi:uncharacterized membrane protein